MRRVWLAVMKGFALVALVQTLTAHATPTCPPSSECPYDPDNCVRYVQASFPWCLQTQNGCCLYTKDQIAYLDTPDGVCGYTLCGSYSGDPPVAGDLYASALCRHWSQSDSYSCWVDPSYC